jgi:CRP-like cAMP-binding protein
MSEVAWSNNERPREGLRDRLLALRSQPLLAPVDDDGLLLLAEHARSARYRAGEVVAREGEPSRGIFVILEGSLVVSYQGKNTVTLSPGSAFGTLALLARQPSGLAVASEGTRLLEIPVAAFENALDENHSLLRSALAIVGSDVLEARDNLPVDPNAPHEIDEGAYFPEPKSMVERLIELRAGSFGSMNLEALVDLSRQMVEVRYRPGDCIWSAGDVSTYSLTIDHGRIRCTAPDGRHVDVARGFTIGVLDVWGLRRRVYDAHAVTDVIAYRVAFESFLTLLETHVEVGLEVLRGFAASLLADRSGR